MEDRMNKQHEKNDGIDMSKFKGSNESEQNHTFPIKQHGTKGLYMITKSCDFIKKYINFGHTIFKHFFFHSIYNWRISDYIQIYEINQLLKRCC